MAWKARLLWACAHARRHADEGGSGRARCVGGQRAQANIRTIWEVANGREPVPTYLAQGVASAASYVTDESTAQVVGTVVDAQPAWGRRLRGV